MFAFVSWRKNSAKRFLFTEISIRRSTLFLRTRLLCLGYPFDTLAKKTSSTWSPKTSPFFSVSEETSETAYQADTPWISFKTRQLQVFSSGVHPTQSNRGGELRTSRNTPILLYPLTARCPKTQVPEKRRARPADRNNLTLYLRGRDRTGLTPDSYG